MIWSARVKSPVAGKASSVARPVDRDIAVGGAHREQAGGAAGDVGEVDRLGLGPEIGPLDRLQIDEIVDQSEQMAAGRGDVGGIAGIIAAQRAFGLGAQALGIVDDMGERARAAPGRAARRTPMPSCASGAGGIVGGRAVGLDARSRRRRRESRRNGPCRRSAARRKADSGRGGRRAARRPGLRSPYARRARSGSAARRPRSRGSGTGG